MPCFAADAPPLISWARSGLMALTGQPDHAPAAPRCDAIAGMNALLTAVETGAAAIGLGLSADPLMLTERAALQGLSRRGRTSCNGSCRLIEARDGWVAVNLPRESDIELLPAWLETSAIDDPWEAVAKAAHGRAQAEFVAAARFLSLAVAACDQRPMVGSPPPPYGLIPYAAGAPGRDWARDPPLVVDLSAMWAGPLCGSLLAAAGARVIKVESVGRPDSLREASPAMHDRLNGDKASVALDFADPGDRARLKTLIGRADIIISSARPRAFAQMGMAPEAMIDRRPGLTWVAVTAHGWTGEDGAYVGFGDDAAVAGGLFAEDEDGRPMFAGDALADPLTGLSAAAGAFGALALGGGRIVDANMSGAAAFVAAHPALLHRSGDIACTDGVWRVRADGYDEPVAPPRARMSTLSAPPFGADTGRVLAEFC